MRVILVLLAALGFAIPTAAPAAAEYQPVNIAHTERIQAGPYGITVGFSTWPLRAHQSLDFTFIPDGGIEAKSGTLTLTNPDGRTGRTRGLARHPRKLDVWGLDITALNAKGDWNFHFELDGPQGHGSGDLRLTVLEQPGPPMALNWAVSLIPLIAIIAFFTTTWRRTRRELTTST
jgi:hypothetical protein